MNTTSYLNKCHFGDVRDMLRRMIADGVKVNTIVTSPPYFGLRSYLPADHPDKAREIGSEPTLREFLDTMTGVMMLAREVLADDGTMWMNMGDSYSSCGRASFDTRSDNKGNAGVIGIARAPFHEFKSKDLIGQPWRLAFALQDAGWYLRQDIIWHKPNPMPESVKDRCTKAHEYIFLLSKSERYRYDFDAVLEPVEGGAHARRAGPNAMRGQGSNRPEGGGRANRAGRDMAAVGQSKTHLPGNVNPPKGQAAYEAGDESHRTKGGLLAYSEKTRKLAEVGSGTKNNYSMDAALSEMRSMRNRRSVWTVASEPYKGSHFATFPTKLIEHCILAGAPVGGIVFDPFFGSGTTGQVAQRLGRNFIGIDINQANKPLQDERLQHGPGLQLEAG